MSTFRRPPPNTAFDAGARPQGGWRAAAEHAWQFDLSGFIVLAGCLSPEELQSCRDEGPGGDACWQLAEHPTLRAKLKQLFGEVPVYDHAEISSPRPEYRLDRPPRLLPRDDRASTN
jgi:hypothetical protein